MPMSLDGLKKDGPGRTVEMASCGFVIVRAPSAQHENFDAFVRDLLDNPNDDYVVLPVTDGAGGYDRVVVVPIDDGSAASV